MKNTKSVLAIFAIIISLFCLTGCKSDDYEAAVSLYDSGDYAAAVSAFVELGDYKDSAERAQMAQTAADYEAAVSLYDSGDYAAAVSAFTELGDYEDSAERAAEAQTAEDERILINEVTEKLVELEDFAAKQMKDYNDYIEGIEGISGKIVTPFYTKVRLDSFPDWRENYDLYSQLIEKDSEKINALASRLKTALRNIDEIRFYITIKLYEQPFSSDYLLLTKQIIARIEKYGLSDKTVESNEELAEVSYWNYYCMWFDYVVFEDALAEISIFPDSEVKTITVQALNLEKELSSEDGLTLENAKRALGLFDELNVLANSIHDMRQPDYYLKNCLVDLAEEFEKYYDECIDLCQKSMGEKITSELEAYYAKTTAGKAPIEITGNELYIAPFTYNDTSRNFGTSDLSNEIFTEDPKLYMHLASKPEEARYLINFSGTASFYGNYTYAGTSSTTKGYSVKVTMYLKDCKTGEILYTQNFSATPPFSINVSGIPKEYYASVSWDDDDLDKFLAVLLPKLGIE